MKKLYSVLILLFLCSISLLAQPVITKTANPTSAYIGEEITYTVTITGLTNLNQLVAMKDDFGADLNYISAAYGSTTLNLRNNTYGNCAPLGSPGFTELTTSNSYLATFTACSGAVSGTSATLSFIFKAKLNANACDKDSVTNNVELKLKDGSTKTASCKVGVKAGHPFTLQKTFRSLTGGQMIYDVRLSSASGNFDMLDPNTLSFRDEFAIPDCMIIDESNSEVVYIPDENDLTIQTPIASSPTNLGSSLDFSWNFLPSTPGRSYLYLVKVGVSDCKCGDKPFTLSNTAYFDGLDVCGHNVNLTASSIIPGTRCGKEPPKPELDSLCISKVMKLDNSDLNLSMNKCSGKYTITIRNCTQAYIYKELSLVDVLPAELYVDPSLITTTGSISITTSLPTITASLTADIAPGDVATIVIPFTINTPLPNFAINNCVTAKVHAHDINTLDDFWIKRKACAIPIVTVPNEVALVLEKKICTEPLHQCGSYTINNFLPGDELEYVMHVYNFGTVAATNVVFTDPLPSYFTIQNLATDVQVYEIQRVGSRIDSNNLCTYPVTKDEIITDQVKIDLLSGNKLSIDFNGKVLPEFTCNGIVHYIIKVKVKIATNTPNGTYPNQFSIDYKPNLAKSSNDAPATVLVDQMIIGDKKEISTVINCDKNTTTVTYQIQLTNMGSVVVNATVKDQISVAAPISLLSLGNYLSCSGAALCTPTTPYTPASSTANGFTANFSLQPCSVTILTYTAVFNTSLLAKGQTVTVCNNATLSTTIPNNEGLVKMKSVAIGNQQMIHQFMTAKSDVEKYKILQDIKAVKTEDGENEMETKLPLACTILKDCLPPTSSNCTPNSASGFGFNISAMNSAGQVTTTLNLPVGKKVTEIE